MSCNLPIFWNFRQRQNNCPFLSLLDNDFDIFYSSGRTGKWNYKIQLERFSVPFLFENLNWFFLETFHFWSLKMRDLVQLTPSWRDRWKPSGTWWTATWRSSPRPAETLSRRSSCISWSTTPNPSLTESSLLICMLRGTRWVDKFWGQKLLTQFQEFVSLC